MILSRLRYGWNLFRLYFRFFYSNLAKSASVYSVYYVYNWWLLSHKWWFSLLSHCSLICRLSNNTVVVGEVNWSERKASCKSVETKKNKDSLRPPRKYFCNWLKSWVMCKFFYNAVVARCQFNNKKTTTIESSDNLRTCSFHLWKYLSEFQEHCHLQFVSLFEKSMSINSQSKTEYENNGRNRKKTI